MNKNTSIDTVKLVQGIGKEVDWTLKKRVQFIESILSLKNADETKRFLRDLMTTGEIEEFSNRLLAAQLLSKDVQYNAITKETGLSSTTIARISKWLNGSLGGYRLILNRLSNTHHHNPTKIDKGLSCFDSPKL